MARLGAPKGLKMSKKLISLVLATLILVSALCMSSCSSKKVMSMEDTKISVSTYEIEFFMTRMKGLLESYGYNVSSSAWWGTIMNMQGMTLDEYYRTRALEEASRYMIAQYLFDAEGLELSKDEMNAVDDAINSLIEVAGSRNALNSVLAEYGVNIKLLREIYLGELKVDKIKEHFFGKDGLKGEDGAEKKQEYLEEKYACYKQVFLAAYYYVTEVDKNGDTIYYTDTKAEKIAYDKENGLPKSDVYSPDKYETDKFGDVIYYTEDGKISYDKSGVPVYILNKDESRKIAFYDSAKIDEIGKLAKELAQGKKTPEEFEALIAQYDESDDSGKKLYLYIEPGYYGSSSDSSAYLDEIAQTVAGLSEGECAMIDSGAGFHIVYAAEHDEGAYADEQYKKVFSGFDTAFVDSLFVELCKEYEDKIKIDDKVIESLPDMKDVASNLLY